VSFPTSRTPGQYQRSRTYITNAPTHNQKKGIPSTDTFNWALAAPIHTYTNLQYACPRRRAAGYCLRRAVTPSVNGEENHSERSHSSKREPLPGPPQSHFAIPQSYWVRGRYRELAQETCGPLNCRPRVVYSLGLGAGRTPLYVYYFATERQQHSAASISISNTGAGIPGGLPSCYTHILMTARLCLSQHRH
jgi:hypothetical protein